MIKSGPYIQMFKFFTKEGNAIVKRYCVCENVDELMMFKRFDELRTLHLKYKSECEQLSIYAHLDLTKLELYKESISDLCNQFHIRATFVGAKTLDFRKGFHCYYWYDNLNVTDLIVFNKVRENSNVSRMNFEI